MNFLRDVITYVRRIIKSPSDATITDLLIIDYINRFWLMDVDARMQLFDLKTKYQFITTPGVDQYNMPLYDVQSETIGMPASQDIASFPVYQGFLAPARVNGYEISFETQKKYFDDYWSTYLQPLIGVAQGNGGSTYQIQIPFGFNNPPVVNQAPSGILRGHVDITGIIATGLNIDPPVASTLNLLIPSTSIKPAVYITTIDSTGANIIASDSGQFLSGNVNYGLLMNPGNAPYGNTVLDGGYSTTVNTINYQTGIINLTFTDHVGTPVNIAGGQNINISCQLLTPGLPRSVLFNNNVLTFRTVPFDQYLVELDAYLTPAAFMNSGSALPFAYMGEYIARGAARKILSDVGDVEQFQFYEPLFREQEMLVWKRSQRQWTANRTETIYSRGSNFGNNGNGNSLGGGSV